MDWNTNNNADIRSSQPMSTGHERHEHAAVHHSHVEGSSHVADGAAGQHSAVYTNLPPYLKYDQDRGKARSEAELKSVFVMESADKYSVDVPGVLENLCGYLHGLEIVSQQLQNMEVQSYVSMYVDVSDTCHMAILSDFASDAEFTWLGFTSDGYQQRLKQVKENGSLHSWLMIYEQFVGHCCEEEKKIAVVVKELRQHPERDYIHFCRNNVKGHFESMLQRWKSLAVNNDILSKESESLKRFKYPCLVEYSNIERQFGSDEFLKQVDVPCNIAIPERWKLADKPTSKWIRQTLSEIVISSNELNARIKTCISRMEDIRKENYTILYNRWRGLDAIVRRLHGIKVNLNSANQVHNTVFTEEETWYNESSYSYADLYLNNADRESSTEAARYEWEASAKTTRILLSKQVDKGYDTLHRQYGDLVKHLRAERESKQRGFKAHVSELEAQIVQLRRELTEQANTFENNQRLWLEKDLRTQSTNADLTLKLEQAKEHQRQVKPQADSDLRKHLERMNSEYKRQIQQLKAQEESRWRGTLEAMNLEHKRQMQHLTAQLAETRKGISDLKVEKDNLLTRLSKIAGSKLVHGNPAITDLSDSNRPTKISEKYSELYDNEWTDALEELTDTIGMEQEVVCTKTLLAILIESFTFCCETEAEYMKTITRSLTSLPGPAPVEKQNGTTDRETLRQEQQQQLDDLRKACVPMLIPAVESKFLDFMENHFENLFKQVGGQSESDSKFPDSRYDLATQKQIPVCAVRENQSADPDNENQQSVSDDGQSTQRPDQVGTHSPTDDQPTTPNSSGQDQAESVPNRNHRHFTHGSAKMLPGKNVLPEHANTTRTTAHVPFSSLKKTPKFARICANLCWFMRVQNPPMVIDVTLKEGDEINFDFYKNYTQKGKRVGYFVWPALFLHKDGPLLCKGIVQPLSTKKD